MLTRRFFMRRSLAAVALALAPMYAPGVSKAKVVSSPCRGHAYIVLSRSRSLLPTNRSESG